MSGAAMVTAAAVAAAIAAAPMKAPGPNPTYPRLTAFPDAAVKAKANALLAAQEKDDRGARKDCLSQKSGSGTRGTWATRTAVTYLSPRFLSVSVTSDYDCGGPYPNDGIETPVTIDLATGAAVDWTKLFKPGFLASPPSAVEAAAASAAAGGNLRAPPAGLSKLYRARYPKGADKECKDLILGDDPFSSAPILWLDKRGLIAQPDFPHVTKACAEEVAIPAAALAPYVRDPAALADWKANGK